MKAWKRNLLIAYLACSAVMVVFFLMFAFGSGLIGLLKFCCLLLGVAVAAGVCVGAVLVVLSYVHERATLQAGPGGAINIERSALESTARRALAQIDGILTVVGVRATVLERKDGAVIDMTVTAVPRTSGSLMVTAGAVQTSVKQAVEAFTDHEVRYVAVNFVEPRSHREAKAADERPAEPRASVWSRAKERVAERVRRNDEDVIQTEAVVAVDEGPAEQPPVAEPADAADGREDERKDEARDV